MLTEQMKTKNVECYDKDGEARYVKLCMLVLQAIHK